MGRSKIVATLAAIATLGAGLAVTPSALAGQSRADDGDIAAAVAASADAASSQIEVGPSWKDTDGNLVEAHGGAANKYNEADLGIDITGDGDKSDDVYLLYGEKKTNATRPVDGVNGYWSTDLENWHYMGNVLRTHNVLPFKVDGNQLALNEDNLAELKRLGNLTEAEAKKQNVDDLAASSRAFLKAYVTEWNADGTAKAYDEDSLRMAFVNLYGIGNIVERPKMIYNATTKQYVIIFHGDGTWSGWDYETGRSGWANGNMIDWVKRCAGENGKNYVCDVTDTGQGSRYSKSELSFAVSSTPTGPFKMVNSTRLNGYTDDEKPSGYNVSKAGMSRDMTIFIDKGHDVNGDGVDDAYAVYSSEENAYMQITLLNKDYTGPAEEGACLRPLPRQMAA